MYAKKIISKQNIINAAQTLVASNRNPTLAAVREQLNYHGSNSTIHKYLKEWKKNCLVQGNIHTTVNIINQPNMEELIEKQYDLEKNLQKQITKNDYYSQELINAEKANIVLKEENHELQTQLQTTQLELKELKSINSSLEQVTTEIKEKLENNDNKTIQNLQQNIETLKAELKKLNETSLEALRETSAKGHDVLMQEKVTSINLQAKVDNLHKELADSKKQLYDNALKYQAQTQAFLRQIDWQQRIMQEHIGIDKLRELTGEPELMLNFSGQAGAAYAK